MENKKKKSKAVKNLEDEKKALPEEGKTIVSDKSSGNFWSKVGKFVKDAVDCCLE